MNESEYFSACSGGNWIGEVINYFSKEIDLKYLNFLKISNEDYANYSFDVFDEEDEEVYSCYLVFILSQGHIIKAIENLDELLKFFRECSLSLKIQSFNFVMSDAQDAIRRINNLDYYLANKEGLNFCLNADREYTSSYYFLGFIITIKKLLEEAKSKGLNYVHIIEKLL